MKLFALAGIISICLFGVAESETLEWSCIKESSSEVNCNGTSYYYWDMKEHFLKLTDCTDDYVFIEDDAFNCKINENSYRIICPYPVYAHTYTVKCDVYEMSNIQVDQKATYDEATKTITMVENTDVSYANCTLDQGFASFKEKYSCGTFDYKEGTEADCVKWGWFAWMSGGYLNCYTAEMSSYEVD